MVKLNDIFFESKNQRISNEIHTVVYQHLFDDMLDRIEDFRCATYFIKDIEYQKKTPVLSKIKITQNTKENIET